MTLYCGCWVLSFTMFFLPLPWVSELFWVLVSAWTVFLSLFLSCQEASPSNIHIFNFLTISTFSSISVWITFPRLEGSFRLPSLHFISEFEIFFFETMKFREIVKVLRYFQEERYMYSFCSNKNFKHEGLQLFIMPRTTFIHSNMLLISHIDETRSDT